MSAELCELGFLEPRGAGAETRLRGGTGRGVADRGNAGTGAQLPDVVTVRTRRWPSRARRMRRGPGAMRGRCWACLSRSRTC
jgi:hypothetical protein